MNDFSSETPKNPEIEKKPLRIIYIEDDNLFRDFIKEKFEEFPADVKLVKSFLSTEEAEKYLIKLKEENEELPDMIISDNSLGRGKRKGLDFAKYLKEQRFEIPFVLYTNDAEQFEMFSEERLNVTGVTKVVDKLKSVRNLVGILNSLRN